MVNYKNGKIYKLVNDELNLTYYGSTCSELRKRLNSHKTRAKNIKDCTSHELFESGICKIYLVEKVSCEDKDELTQKERFYIENNECVNKVIPGRTDNEYRNDNKDKIKEYRQINKQKISQQKKEYYLKKKAQQKEYYQVNKEKIAEQSKRYRQINKEKIAERNKKYRQINKEKIAEREKKYNEVNKDKIAQKRKEYYLNKKAQEKQVYDFLTQIENSI